MVREMLRIVPSIDWGGDDGLVNVKGYGVLD